MIQKVLSCKNYHNFAINKHLFYFSKEIGLYDSKIDGFGTTLCPKKERSLTDLSL